MKKRHLWALVCGGVLITTGCSQETMDRAEQAGGAAGEAIKSAADDTAKNVDEAARTVDEAIEVNEGDPEAAAGEDTTP